MTASVRTTRLAALSAPRYVQLTGYAQAANVTLATLESRAYLVVPVVAMVGGSVVQGMNSRGPEYVPPEVLANFPESFNGRPIVPVHPYNGTGSANDPHTQNKYRFGQVFNARFDDADGNLKLDAWLDIERAKALGGDPESVVADCQAGKLVEVSLGAWIVMAEEDGETEDGRAYSYVWQYITSYDHLAMGLAGLAGACSVEMGCGAPRMNNAAQPVKSEDGTLPAPTLRSNALAKARRPTFNGTETTTWSSPSWHEWVTALHTGNESPKSIADATDALKAAIARHTLLGDPNADNLRDLTLFPVVNPHSGRLNERALRAVLGGRGSQADIPDAAKTSAQDMARSLLKSEFDIELDETSKESANMADPSLKTAANTAGPAPAAVAAAAKPTKPATPSLFARAISSLATVFRSQAGSTEGTSNSELRSKLAIALRATEPAYGDRYWYGDGIVDIWPDTSTVVYCTCPEDETLLWQQTYTLDAAGNVTLNGDRERVEYRPVPITSAAASADSDASDADESDDPNATMPDMPVGGMTAAANAAPPTCGCNKSAAATTTLSDPATDAPAAVDTATATSPNSTTTSTEGDPTLMAATVVSPVIKTLVARLVANSGVFTADSIPTLEALPEAELTAMCERLAPVQARPASNTATATVTPAAVEPAPAIPAANAAAAAAQPESLESLLPRLPADLQAFIASNTAAMEQRKATLLAAIGTKSKATAATLAANSAVDIPQLEAMAQELGCFTPAPIPSYAAAGLPVTPATTAHASRVYKVPKPYDMALNAMGKPGIGKNSAETPSAGKPN